MKSFIDTNPDTHFPIQNLPYGVFSTNKNSEKRVGVAIGDFVLDLSIIESKGFFNEVIAQGQKVFNQSYLNSFMALGNKKWREVRKIIQSLLSADNPKLRDNAELRNKVLVPINDITLHLPVKIGDYTDFYSSKEHATNVGTMFRGKDNALMPNWTHLPVAYHGRSSSIVLSGSKIRRPLGQIKLPEDPPIFGPSRQLDFELEAGCFIGVGNRIGEPISIENAEEKVFGMVLVNDWSARDIQSWEYQPLGPFLAKNFATSISPWVVPMEALQPFRVNGPNQDPKPLKYLEQNRAGLFDIHLEVHLRSKEMTQPKKICESNYRKLYWSIAQQIAHHTVGGCNLNTGDLLASGTISGSEKGERGSLLETTWRGTDPIQLNEKEKRVWLEDGDELSITGWCQGDGYRIGFGEVVGVIEPSIDQNQILLKEKQNIHS